MEKPKPYGIFHLSFVLIGVLLCIFAAYKLRRVNEKQNRIILISVGVFLMLTEVYKQLFYYFIVGNHSYEWWIFPFQLCSVPMYLCVIAPLLRAGKLQRGMYHFMSTYNLLGGIMALAEPSGLLHKYLPLTLHAFLWHILLIFIGLYLIATGRFAKTASDFRQATYTFFGLAVLAFCINLIFWRVSEGTINMFYVGPRYSPLVVFKPISQNVGWYASTALYLPVVCLGAYLVYLPAHLYARKHPNQE
jgi:uncharacterized membrane protein YwaF